MELMVLIAESASAPPRLAARAGMRMSEIFGVSLTITGVRAFSFTQPVICWQYSGTCPTADPMPRSLMPCGQPKLSSRPSAPASSARCNNVVPGLALALDHERSDDHVARIAPLDFGHLLQVDLDGAVGDELDVIEAHHAAAIPVDGGVA